MNEIDIKVERMYKFADGKPLKAFADIVVNDVLLIKSLKVIEGNDGLFVSMPQEQAKNSRWYESVRCLSKDLKDRIAREVIQAYEGGV